MLIDFHTHIHPPGMGAGEPWAGDATYRTLYSHARARTATAEELIASMDRAGITVSVALNTGWQHQELCVQSNDYIVEAVRRFPGRIVGFCTVNPLAQEAAVKEVERCARSGIRGVGELHPDTQGFDLGDERAMAPVMDAARRLNMIVLCHASEPVGHNYPGKGHAIPEVLYRFIAAFPEVPIVLAHWGGGLPFYALMPEAAKALRNVYFDSAASPLLYKPQVFRQAAELVGPERLLFGSDFPLLGQERVLRQAREAGLPREAEDLLLGDNAKRLLGL